MPYKSTDTKQSHTPIAAFYEARFSDGKTAAAEDAHVAMSPRGLIIRRASTAEDLIWPYGALTTSEPLSPHAVDAQVSYTYQPGASLFVPNGRFARELAKSANHLTTRAVRRRAAMPWLWAAAGTVVAIALISMSSFSPARTIAGFMPERLRQSLGEQTIATIARDRPVCAQPDGRRAVDTLTARLAGNGSGANQFDVIVVDWDLVNAFATPGNKIVLTSGLIGQAESPDEVAGVLAHELGHVRLLHPETSLVRVMGMSAAVELLLGGGSGTLANIGVLLTQLSYTRQAEVEADTSALETLKSAGISAQGLADFFRRVDAKETKDGDDRNAKSHVGGSLMDMLRTHPRTGDRVRSIEGAGTYEATGARSPKQWRALSSICDADGN